MTTLWDIPSNFFEGQTVAILGTGPSLTPEAVAGAMKYRTIAINRAIKLAPDAEMMLALDGNWPQEWRDFAGLKITGCADDTLDAMYIGMCYERIAVSKTETVEARKSGLAAIRLAAKGGAAKILLVGFDPHTAAHFHDSSGAGKSYQYLAQGLEAIIKELKAKGIEIEFYVKPESEPKKRISTSFEFSPQLPATLNAEGYDELEYSTIGAPPPIPESRCPENAAEVLVASVKRISIKRSRKAR